MFRVPPMRENAAIVTEVSRTIHEGPLWTAPVPNIWVMCNAKDQGTAVRALLWSYSWTEPERYSPLLWEPGRNVHGNLLHKGQANRVVQKRPIKAILKSTALKRLIR